ncbi:MAG: DUF4956 domain-containing protein [Lachnospiraceae bacterium]|nr:DUF4956 domain-containing protein [Lachnospiraceae bacterium]
MLSTVFQGIFDATASSIAVSQFMLCILVSLLIGAFLAFTYNFKNITTKSFLITLAILPAIVCVVIMMVNGNIGAGVAVAGAFSLVRFRSAPGSAKEIAQIFLAMGAGLITGMGYLGYAILFTLVLQIVFIILSVTGFGKDKSEERILRITIPEDLDFAGEFDDLFNEYTDKCENISVKTTNMGSLFKLSYNILMKDAAKEKEFMDALRCRNGNLEISISKQEMGANEL